jgi:ATP-dependent RNA helicase MSS116, mitochondrial
VVCNLLKERFSSESKPRTSLVERCALAISAGCPFQGPSPHRREIVLECRHLSAAISSSQRSLHSGVLDNERGASSTDVVSNVSGSDISTPTYEKSITTSPETLPRFRDLAMHPRLCEALDRRWSRSDVHLDTQLTEVQHQVWKASLTGSSPSAIPTKLPQPTGYVDVVARARTGTGKTLAYLLPALDRLCRERDLPNEGRARRGVRMLVLSPTRELARQIYGVAVGLTRAQPAVAEGYSSFHRSAADVAAASDTVHGDENVRDSMLSCQVLHGGVPRRIDLDAFHREIPDILIATPGRLLDHITSTYVGGDGKLDRKPFSSFLQSVSVLVIDEVDRLLDMGFRDDLTIILNQLPFNRQTFLLSATLPASVRDIMLQHVHPTNHVILDCVRRDFKSGWDDEHGAATTVKQSYSVLPMDRMISGVVEVIYHLLKPRGGSSKRPSNYGNKLLVFFPTTSQVMFFHCLLNQHLGRHAWELHSGMSQSQRQTASDAFRHATSGVLLTSDVSARGVDYPNVSHVIQVGMARNRETYLHRLGRTGRAGRGGKGILLLLEPELGCLRIDLSGLSIGRNPSLQRLLDRPPSSRLKSDLLQLAHDLRHGQADALTEHAEACYRSLLSYYYSRLASNEADDSSSRVDAVVDLANAFSYQSGLPELPSVPVRLAMQYGMLNHPKLNIDQRWTVGTRFDVGPSTINDDRVESVGSDDKVANPEASELWSNEEKLD